MPAEKFGRYKPEVEGRVEPRGRLVLRNKIESKKHLVKSKIYGGISKGL